MTPAERIAEIRDRLERASPKVWTEVIIGSKHKTMGITDGRSWSNGGRIAVAYSTENQSLIAHAPADLRFLLSELAERERVIAEHRKVLGHCRDAVIQGNGPLYGVAQSLVDEITALLGTKTGKEG